MIKFDQILFLAIFFDLLIKWLDTFFARDLGGIIRRHVGSGLWATTYHDSIRVGYSDTQHPCID